MLQALVNGVEQGGEFLRQDGQFITSHDFPWKIDSIPYSEVFSIALPDGLLDVGEGTVDMGDLSLNDLLRRAESLVEDLIGYFKSGMLKKGRPFEHLTNFDIAICGTYLQASYVRHFVTRQRKIFQSNGLLSHGSTA